MTEKPRSIQEMMGGIKRKYYDEESGAFTDAYYLAKYEGMQEIQKEIEKWIEDETLLAEQRVILRQLHGQL